MPYDDNKVYRVWEKINQNMIDKLSGQTGQLDKQTDRQVGFRLF